MRVNIYAEEMTDRVEIISKEIEGQVFTGLRIYLELPVTTGWDKKDGKTTPVLVSGPFLHSENDDDSSAITFWGKGDLRILVDQMRVVLDQHYRQKHEATHSQGEPQS